MASALTQLFPNVFYDASQRKLYTANAVKGFRVHGEALRKEGKREFREWNPRQSKLAAAIVKGLKTLPIKPGARVLYLGAAQGATASFVSDIVGARGVVYCVEFSPRAMRDLLRVCEARENMLPLLADARKPEDYANEIGKSGVDVVFEDVADPQQAEILIANSRFLKKSGAALVAVKSQCISSVAPPEASYAEFKKKIALEFEIVEELRLEPFEEGHAFYSLRKKKQF
ncbi:MAG: fibrillarin-like rRNA/tRNA 2'-O-methyltransferase [Candidatus Norongarragalinales archaeon]